MRPVRLDAIELPHRVAVVATFPRIVRCGPCTGPPGTSGVRGRSFRFSFDRTTHSTRNGNTLTIRRCRTRSTCYDGMPRYVAPSGDGVTDRIVSPVEEFDLFVTGTDVRIDGGAVPGVMG